MNLIYGLLDPRTNCLRYIGQSSRGLTRPRSHLLHSRASTKTHLSKWLQALFKESLKPEIIVIEEVLLQSDLDESEVFWIAYFRSLGCDLTNLTLGGRYFTITEEFRQKQSEAQRAAWSDPGEREKRLEAQAKARNRPEYHESLSDAQKARWSDANAREKQSKTQSDVKSLPENRDHQRSMMKKCWDELNSDERSAWVKKISEANKKRVGTKHSEETKQKMRDAKARRKEARKNV